jgi:hypothetical protein
MQSFSTLSEFFIQKPGQTLADFLKKVSAEYPAER